MAYPAHLLEQAKHLANREKKRPRQASLRRAVSTAYYALFHLLIYEATLNWKQVEQRPLLARFFEHGKMKNACEKQKGACRDYFSSQPPPPAGPNHDCMTHLQKVSHSFFQAQQQRHSADYDNSKEWTRIEVLTMIQLVEEAFDSWRQIRDHSFAQEFLISLLGNPKGN
jgi:uncharacterized protein (UPF0332 family)